jgi:nucleoid DNA-binding protein
MKNVTKKELVEQIAEKTGLTRVDTKIIVESFLDSVSQALQAGTNIEIRKFGRFKIKKKRARRARNPRTNQYIDVAAGYKPVFEASKELRKRINDAAGLHPTSKPAAAPPAA